MSIPELIIKSIKTKIRLLKDKEQLFLINSTSNLIIKALKNGNKILIAGNGGSAADAQHFAAELAGKFIRNNRKPLPAIALTANSSTITALGNDFGYENVFLKQIEALGNKGDILFLISTSGNSMNLIKAVRLAKEKNLTTISLLGNNGGRLKQISDLSIIVPSENTQNIQEAHILIIHIICEAIENAF